MEHFLVITTYLSSREHQSVATMVFPLPSINSYQTGLTQFQHNRWRSVQIWRGHKPSCVNHGTGPSNWI